MSWCVRCMIPTNLINYSMAIWRKLISLSRSVLYLWLDTTHTYTNTVFKPCRNLSDSLTIFSQFLYFCDASFSTLHFLSSLGTRGGD